MNREKAIDLLDNLIGMVEDNQESDYDTALKMGIQALSQEPTEKPMCDRNICISNEYNGIGCDECIVNKVGHKPCRVKNELNVELNELKPCTDTVSREAVIEILENYGCTNREGLIFKDIRALPSVTQKSGKWIEDAKTYYEELNKRGLGVDEYTPYFTDDIACSECLAKYNICDNETQFFKYCPNCGAKMVEPQKSEE